MNKIDERRRALLAGKVPRTYVFKEGSTALENGSSFSILRCARISGGNIVISKTSSSVASMTIETDFTGYSKLFIEANISIIKGPATAYVKCSGSDNTYITTTRQIYEFNIESYNGTREIYARANREYSDGQAYAYIYNIWLE